MSYVNGSLNIMRKALPNVFDHGIEEPVRWAGLPTVTQLAWCCSASCGGAALTRASG